MDPADIVRRTAERLKNEGQAYANDVIPKARGTAARVLQEAEGYRQRVVANAEGDASRFSQVLDEYAKAPKVTRDRMYLETMESIFSNTSKVYLDSRSSGNLLYLPLDKLLGQAGADVRAGSNPASAASAPESAPPAPRSDGLRSRERDSR